MELQLTAEFKPKVIAAMAEARKRYGGSDAAFAKSLDLNSTSYNRLKNGQTEKLLSDSAWLMLGRKLDVAVGNDNWRVARTPVYKEIEDNLKFCQAFSKSMVLIDDCGIGKTFSSKHICKVLKNAFYMDCSQAKTKSQFIRELARTVGVDNRGRLIDVKADLKYYLNLLTQPIIVLDDAGYLDYPAFLEVQELWNGTEGSCGWYMIGDYSLQTKIERGIDRKKIGYEAIFSRFSDQHIHLIPKGKDDRRQYYTNLIGAVAQANGANSDQLNRYIKQCLAKNTSLRYLETLIQLNGKAA